MSAICDAHKKKVYVELLYITQCTGNSISWRSDEWEIRCSRENQHIEKLGPQPPGWAAQENGKETQLWPIEWGSICCSSVRSLTHSHSKTFGNPFEPFQIKWEVYFSKELCRSFFIVSLWFCMHMRLHMSIQHK